MQCNQRGAMPDGDDTGAEVRIVQGNVAEDAAGQRCGVFVARHWLAPWHKLGRKIAMDEDWLRYGVTAVAPATSAG